MKNQNKNKFLFYYHYLKKKETENLLTNQKIDMEKKKKKKGNLEGLLVVGARRGLERPISAITESPGSSYG
jgi:hypothetical protein